MTGSRFAKYGELSELMLLCMIMINTFGDNQSLVFAQIVGSPGDDVIIGIPESEIIAGLSRDNVIDSREGSDTNVGDNFDDAGNGGDDVIIRGDGNDENFGDNFEGTGNGGNDRKMQVKVTMT